MDFKIADKGGSFETYQGNLNQNFFMYIAQIVLILAMVIDYATTTNIDHVLGNAFYLLPIAILIPTLVPKAHNLRLFSSNFIVLTFYHVLFGLFLTFLTPIFGPYFLLFALLMFVGTYWHGFKGLLLSFTLQGIAIYCATWYQGFELTNNSHLFETVLRLILLLSIGLLFVHMTARDRRERDRLVTVSEEAHFERTRLLSLINSMADAVVAINGEGKILLYNGAALDLFNTNATLDNQPLAQFIKLYNESEKEVDLIHDARRIGTVIKRDDLSFTSNDGQEVNLSISVSPIRLSGGIAGDEGYILLMRDITKEKSLDEQRDEFISVASHELRTPIAIVEANISTALMPKFSENLAPEAKNLLEQAHQNVLFLADLVNDLTTLSRAERGDLDIELEEVDPSLMANKLLKDYERQAADKGLKLAVKLPAKLPKLTSNYQRMREILQNFVTNAIKYTEKGSVEIAAIESPERDGVVFSIKDTGIGIGQSDKKKIFGKFYRSEDFRTRQHNGTGLGLYIARQLARTLGGKIWFDSKLNEGSTFNLWLPLHAPAPRKRPSEKA